MDTQLALRKTDEGLVVSHEKARWSEPIKPFGLRIADTANGGVEVIHTGAANRPVVNETDQFILDALDQGSVTRKALIELAEAEDIAMRTLDGRLRALVVQKMIRKLPRDANNETPYTLEGQPANLQPA